VSVHVQNVLVQEAGTFKPVDFPFIFNPFSCILSNTIPSLEGWHKACFYSVADGTEGGDAYQ